jgi:hypothetical protein
MGIATAEEVYVTAGLGFQVHQFVAQTVRFYTQTLLHD